MPAKQTSKMTLNTLTDPAVPEEHRLAILHSLCGEIAQPGAVEVLRSLLSAASEGNGENLAAKKALELAELIAAIKEGPLRAAIYIDRIATDGGAVHRVKVRLLDGAVAYPVVVNDSLAETLCRGDCVLLDGQAGTVLFREPAGPAMGEVARLERVLDPQRILVHLDDHRPHVFFVADGLAQKIASEEVQAGRELLVDSRVGMAFDALPEAEGYAHYRFLSTAPIPDVRLERDVANPPGYVYEALQHVRTAMEAPELLELYRLRKSKTYFLTGAPGTGKSLSIDACIRETYEVMSEITGVSVPELPPRVFRVRASEVLSKWYGQSEKNLKRLFDEIEQLAGEVFVAPDGRTHELPVIVIIEEIDGLARSRGDDAISDRIQTTLLERLDVNRCKLGKSLCLFLCTSNTPELIDSGVARRIQGKTEFFGRLEKRGAFEAVLARHLRGLPIRIEDDRDAAGEAERVVRQDVCGWLFSPNGHDIGQVELIYAGSATADIRYRRDLLTGDLVNRAVQQAATEASLEERRGGASPGITSKLLISALERQVDALAAQLNVSNAERYLRIPAGARVGRVRRIPQPAVRPYQLER